MGDRALSTRAVGAGAFGGSREGVERALSRERFQDQVADVSGRLRQAGFESGAQRFAADRAAQLQAAQAQLSGLAGAAAGLAAATGAGATGAGAAGAAGATTSESITRAAGLAVCDNISAILSVWLFRYCS